VCVVLLPLCTAAFLFLHGGAVAQVIPTPALPLNSNAATDSGDDFFMRFADDGAGNWVAVWESDDTLGTTIGVDSDVLVSMSADNGVTWSTPAALNSNAVTDSGGDFEPHVATDGSGIWVAVWTSLDDLGTTIGTDDDILFSRSLDNGATWSAVAPLNTNATTDAGADQVPLVVSAGGGNWVTFWQSTDTLGTTIGIDGDILFSRSIDSGVTWSAPAALNTNATTDAGDDFFVDVTTDGGANWVAVWESDENLGGLAGLDVDVFVSTSGDFGVSWSGPVVLNTNAATDSGNDFRPTVTTDQGGNWVSVWHSQENLIGLIGTDRDILTARSTNNGTSWTTPLALNSNATVDSGQDFCPRTATDGLGNWVAVWESTDDLGGSIGTDSDLFAARSSDNGASWTVPLPLNSGAATDTGDDIFPQIAFSGALTIVIAWHSSDSLGSTIGIDNDILTSQGILALPGAGGGGGGDSGCFIASAAYGTNLGERLDTLRAFRDEYLLQTTVGQVFVDTYYRLSPSIAHRVAQSPVLAAVVRALLTPAILATSAFMAQPAWFYAATLMLFAALLRTRIRRATSSRQ